jgi:hypothetical protein
MSCHAPLVQVDVGLLQDEVRETATNTADLRHGVHDLVRTLHVGVQDTQDVLELIVLDRQRLQRWRRGWSKGRHENRGATTTTTAEGGYKGVTGLMWHGWSEGRADER